MSDFLAGLIEKSVSVLTNDGKVIVGLLRGFDNLTNVILESAEERVFSEEEGVEIVELGLYIVRGDNLAIIGENQQEKDDATDWSSVRGRPLGPINH